MAKRKKQVAALPVRITKSGKVRVMLVTSRETKRWVTPKGWPMDGKSLWRAAEIEALEEAGIEGRIYQERIGTYDYKKRLKRGALIDCRVGVYPLKVKRLKKRWLERDERKRKWFSPKKAARLVKEPELSDILKRLKGKHTGMKDIMEKFSDNVRVLKDDRKSRKRDDLARTG